MAAPAWHVREVLVMRHSIPFSQLVEEELLSYPHDALSLPDALKAAGAIFVNVLMRQHNLVALQGHLLIEPVEAYHALGASHVGAILAFAERQRDPRLSELLIMLVQGVVGNSALSFLDTPQIPHLVERVAAAAIVCRERYPELCRFWIEGGPLPDIGKAVISQVHEQLMIDEHWTARFDTGFTWIGYRLAQTVEWLPHYWDFATWGTIVRSSTVVLHDVRVTREEAWDILRGLSVYSSASSWDYDEDRRVLRSVCHYFVHEQKMAFRARQHGSFSMLQLCEAEQMADVLANKLRGAVAAVPHPTSGWRDMPDDMLNLVEDIVRPKGAGESLFATDQELDSALLGIEAHGMVEESPGRDRILIRLNRQAEARFTVRFNTSQRHPLYGAGVSMATVLEQDLDEVDLSGIWAYLVDLQGKSPEGRGYGSWAVIPFEEGPRLAFCRFIPNMMAGPGVLRDALYCELGRTRMLSEVLGQVVR
jgi:hypothetical protein